MKEYYGVFKIDCKVNGIPMEFIFDTGASNVSISSTEASFLIKQGLITKEDIKGSTNFQNANGKILEGTKINLKSIEVAGMTINDVTANVVHDQNAPLLLGQSLLSRLGKITIDGNNLIIHNQNINSDIATIEELSTYTETTFGINNSFRVEINFNPNTGKIVYKKFSDELNQVNNWEMSFYIEDVVKSSMEHKITKNIDGLYNIWIDFKTNDKSIEWKTTSFEKGKEYTAITEKEYKNFMVLVCNGNSLPKRYLEKYLESWKSILGIEFSTEKPD
jgi:clan AA aspartic protease (TIGR02281 family)